MGIRVLLVDDHSVVREGLRMLLSRDPELEVVGEAADGAEAIEQARQLRPDVVVMDLLLPVLDGLAATRAIRTQLPETEVLALTSVLENASVLEAIRAGAIGYLFKDSQAAELRSAIKAAAAGQVHLSAQASASLLGAMRMPERPDPLTVRELEVLRLLAQGHSNKEVARRLSAPGRGDRQVPCAPYSGQVQRTKPDPGRAGGHALGADFLAVDSAQGDNRSCVS